MKKNILLLGVLILSITHLFSQDVGINPNFFSTRNLRLAAGMGIDGSWAGDNGKTGLISQNGSIDKDNFSFFNSTPNVTASFGFDLYSPTSVVGLYTGLDLNFQEYSIKSEQNSVKDSISTTNIEIPLYIKFRFGKVRSKGHLWFAVGGGYSFTTKAETIVDVNGFQTTIDSKDYFASFPYLSGIIGYEFLLGSKEQEEVYNRDMFRILLFAKANYDLDNRLILSEIDSTTALNTYQEPSIEYLRICFGIKILLRLSKAAEILGESVIRQIDK